MIFVTVLILNLAFVLSRLVVPDPGSPLNALQGQIQRYNKQSAVLL